MAMRMFPLMAGLVSRAQSWLGAMMRRKQLEGEMEAELAAHLEQLTADLVRAGHTADDAARQAHIALGSAITHKEQMRASLGLRWWDELGANIRYGARILRKSPGFTMIAAASLALAIGANTTIFSMAKRLLLDRLAVQQAEQLRLLHWVGDKHVAITHMWGMSDEVPDGFGGA